MAADARAVAVAHHGLQADHRRARRIDRQEQARGRASARAVSALINAMSVACTRPVATVAAPPAYLSGHPPDVHALVKHARQVECGRRRRQTRRFATGRRDPQLPAERADTRQPVDRGKPDTTQSGIDAIVARCRLPALDLHRPVFRRNPAGCALRNQSNAAASCPSVAAGTQRGSATSIRSTPSLNRSGP
ncbi:MAG: hypothetical protein MZV65_45390 [Chromatiales bacterium]|nr:hypothetical protein [Chromatiales bacterium]